MDVKRKLVNGSRGTVTGLFDVSRETEPRVEVRFDHMPNDIVVVSPIERRAESSAHSIGGRVSSVTRKQLPLALCYAMSIHKAQGQSFSASVEVNIAGWGGDVGTLRPLVLVGISRVTRSDLILRLRMKAPPIRSRSKGALEGAIKDRVESILNHDREGRKERFEDLLRRDQEELA